jgi:hypothetical protein
MPHRRVRALPAKPPRRPPLEFRKQFDKLEARRAELFARLQLLSKRMRRHPGYKHALTLLNYTFSATKTGGTIAGATGRRLADQSAGTTFHPDLIDPATT